MDTSMSPRGTQSPFTRIHHQGGQSPRAHDPVRGHHFAEALDLLLPEHPADGLYRFTAPNQQPLVHDIRGPLSFSDQPGPLSFSGQPY